MPEFQGIPYSNKCRVSSKRLTFAATSYVLDTEIIPCFFS